ncbi:MAG: DUF916 domain-containing protein, partial [Actinomycetota bacterium]|nr:DUF916 domain-containing protein [Actinomycetota bacterium]
MLPLSRTLALTAAMLVGAAWAAPASGASAAMQFSVRPDASGSLSEGSDYFVLRARPGDVVADALEVSNQGARPVRVRLAPVDATTAQFGGVDYSASGVRPRAVGAWIELDDERVTLAPGEVREVPFRVVVPAGAPSGINLGGIAAWTPSRGGDGRDGEGLAATVEVQTRRVVAAQVELPGPAEPVLEIEGVGAVARPDGTYLQVDVRNVGHGFASGDGTLELPGESFSSALLLDKVVPGTGVGYPVAWRAGAPREGSYEVAVEIDYGSGVAQYRGEVVVGGKLRESLADRGIGGHDAAGFPLLPAGAAALVVATAAAAIVWRR